MKQEQTELRELHKQSIDVGAVWEKLTNDQRRAVAEYVCKRLAEKHGIDIEEALNDGVPMWDEYSTGLDFETYPVELADEIVAQGVDGFRKCLKVSGFTRHTRAIIRRTNLTDRVT